MDSCRDKSKQDKTFSQKSSIKKSQATLQEVPDKAPEGQGPIDSKISIPELAFVFNPVRDQIKPYHLDGDTTMYTETSIARRNALKSDTLVIESINDFITLYQTDTSGCIGRKEYERMYGKLCNVLRVGVDPAEYKRILDDEWKKDSKGYEKMTKDMIFDCLFELCDIWCPNIAAMEYKAFFDQVKFRIRYERLNDVSAYDILK